jgi:ATP-dependent Clp protease ATP-binding subunit ClpC
MLLQILEDGVLTDAKGRKVSFRNTIIMLTSNIGAKLLQKEVSFGFQADKNNKNLDELHKANSIKVKDELKKHMRPELINRIDKIIVFRALSKSDVKQIIDLQIGELAKRLVRQKIGIKISVKAKNILLKKGYDQHNGVRPMRRLIQDDIEDTIAEYVLDESVKAGDIIDIDANQNSLVFNIISE